MIKASLILAAAVCVTRFCRRLSAAQRHVLWAAATISAALLPLLSFILPPWQPDVARRIASVLPSIPQMNLAQSTPSGAEVVVRAEGISSAPAISPILMSIWLGGVLVGAFFLIAGSLRLKRLGARAQVCDSRWSETAENLSRAMGLGRPFRILQSPAGAMPLTWGFLRPRVLLPISAVAWSDDRLRVVLGHELAHVHRRDWFFQLLAEIARTVYWFNPLFWIACNELHQESEHACDDTVVNLGIDGRDYAEHLLELARALRHSGRCASSALAMAHQSNLERRFVALVNSTLNRTPVTRNVLIATIVSTLCVVFPFAAIRAPLAEAIPAIHLPRINSLPTLPDETTDASGVDATMIPPEVVLYATPPLYSDEARRRGIEGVVTAEVRVGVDGRVVGLRVAKGLGFGLDENALLAVRNWQFAAGKRNGKPVEMTTRINVEFSLRNEELNDLIANDMATRIGPDVSPPRIIYRVEPQYSDSARAERLSGTVVLDLIILEDGTPKVLRVVRSVRSDLDQNAINALEQWRLSPATKNSRPVKVRMNIEVNFNLRSSA